MNQDAQAPAQDQNQDQVLTAKVHKPWLLKIAAVMVVMLGFAIWGYIDATRIYPERGYQASKFLEWQYLQKLSETGELAKAGVDDPAATIAQLKQRAKDGISLSPGESTRLAWLSALKTTGLLKPEFTKIPRENPREKVADPSDRMATLQQQFTQSSGKFEAPKPLSDFDIPVQWLFVGLGFPIGFYLLWLIIRVLGQKHTYNPATQTLTLADGTSLTPAQLEDIDKRKWHKYMVALIPAAGHPRAGQSIEIDLLRHRELEEWILAMEATRFPERAAEAQKAAEEAAAQPAEETPAQSEQ